MTKTKKNLSGKNSAATASAVSNERRLQSLEKQKEKASSRKHAIQAALSSVDTFQKQGQHTKFDLSNDTSSEEEMETKNNNDEKSTPKNSLVLFDSSEDEAEEDGDDTRFEIRPQFEGREGEKLMKIQERIGTDERFKMDVRFMKSESEGTEKEVGSSPVKKEQKKNLDILQSIIGTSIALEPKKANFKDMSMLHYDPTKEDHRSYEVNQERSIEKEPEKKKSKREFELSSKMPEVSKDIFFEINDDLKAAFNSNGNHQASSFNFFPEEDSRKDFEPSNYNNKEDENNTEQKVMWKSEIFKFLNANGEEEDERSNCDESTDKNWLLSKEDLGDTSNHTDIPQAASERFFFSMQDARLKEGVKLFCCTDSEKKITDWWEKERPDIEQINNKRYKQAIKSAKKNTRKKRNVKH